MQARNKLGELARKTEHDMIRSAGLGFAGIVEQCLSWKAASDDDTAVDQLRLYEKVISTLHELVRTVAQEHSDRSYYGLS